MEKALEGRNNFISRADEWKVDYATLHFGDKIPAETTDEGELDFGSLFQIHIFG